MPVPLNRRRWIAAAAGVPLLAAAPKWRLGLMDGVVHQPGRPESMAEAARFGLRGVQVTIPRPAAGTAATTLDDPAQVAAIRNAATKHGITINATYLEVLHIHCLKNDPEGKQWVRRGITLTRALGAPILMTVFFGKCALQDAGEREAVAGAFRELAPEARDAGIVLGFENLLKAEDSAWVLDRVGSEWLKVYYDVGNATNVVGVDPAREIRWLGRDRICQFHLKDKGYLGEGKVVYPPIMEALSEIGYSGWANLETSSPSGDMESDLRRNLQYLARNFAAGPA